MKYLEGEREYTEDGGLEVPEDWDQMSFTQRSLYAAENHRGMMRKFFESIKEE